MHTLALSDVLPAVWALGLTFPIIMVAINELVKHREIKWVQLVSVYHADFWKFYLYLSKTQETKKDWKIISMP